MAKVKPFRGIRPPRELVTEVASRPYDVLNSEEARAEAEGNPRSLYHIIKPEIDFAPGTDEHAPEVYDKAVENFKAFRDNGWLVQDENDHYYIYAQTMTDARSTALWWRQTWKTICRVASKSMSLPAATRKKTA